MKFENTAKPTEKKYGSSYYGYDEASSYLLTWSSLFQSVVSQAGTYLLTGKFHDSHTGIFKCEGGCNIAGFGDLVLYKESCRFDYNKSEKEESLMADLITYIVLHWNPENPIDSMIQAASDFVFQNTNADITSALKDVLKKSGGLFNGDSLCSFFDYNPFSPPEQKQDYLRFCLVNFNGKTNEEVDQQFSDKNLGKELLKRLNDKIRKANPGSYHSALCCSPNRRGNELKFWVNTGRSTQIDGWKTQKELEDFINSDGILIDKARY